MTGEIEQEGVAEARLRALLAFDAAPERDPHFVIETMQRVARWRLLFGLLAGVPWLVAGAAILWAVRPLMAQFGESFGLWMSQIAGMGAGFGWLAPVAAVLLGLVFIAPAHERAI